MFVILVSALLVAVLLDENNVDTLGSDLHNNKEQAVNHRFE